MGFKKIRVAVLYGGRSGEHEVSLRSAFNVIHNLDRSRFEVIPIGIDKQGVWYLGDDVLKKELAEGGSLRLRQELDRMLFNPDALGSGMEAIQPTSLLSRVSKTRLFDVVFPVIHGTLCEDGTVQGLLELAEVPYVGCGVLSSAINMDKDVSKRLVKAAGISVAPFLVIRQGQWNQNEHHYKVRIANELGYPVFVKPANTGSSVGVHKVKTEEGLEAAIQDALRYDVKLVVEKALDVMECEVALLESLNEGEDPLVSVVGEIRPTASHEFYSYASKYLDENGAELIIPAPLSEALSQKVRDVAKHVFQTLECEGMSRVDLFIERKTGEIYFNEVNTIPGFTQISMYPKLMGASGVGYSDLLTHLVMLAVLRGERKKKLSHEFLPAQTEKNAVV